MPFYDYKNAFQCIMNQFCSIRIRYKKALDEVIKSMMTFFPFCHIKKKWKFKRRTFENTLSKKKIRNTEGVVLDNRKSVGVFIH